MHNSNVFPFQLTLEGESLYEFELIGVVTLEGLAEKREPPLGAGDGWAFTVFVGRDFKDTPPSREK